MRTIENDVPQILLDLAKEAFSLGLGKVSLRFMYMGADFVSPLEWALWLEKREGPRDSEHKSYISAVTMQRGDDEATSYVPSTTDDWRDSSYWGPDEIRAWMREPLPEEGEYTPAWTPQLDGKRREKLMEQWELFEAGVRGGWVMQREIRWSDSLSMVRMAERHNAELPEDYLPTLNLEWKAYNSFYNYEDHEAHRDNGTETSIGGWSMIPYGEAPKFFVHDGGKLTSLTPEYVHELLHSTAPWFVRVALNDEEAEEWLHYPEALQPEEFTIKETNEKSV